jgi:hypothetical protein
VGEGGLIGLAALPTFQTRKPENPKDWNMKFEDLKAIDKRADQGAWIDNLANLPGVAVKVRAEMNADYEKLSGELWGKIPADKRDDPEIEDAISKECMAKTVLLDWKGFEDLPCTPENIDKALDIRIFRQGVRLASRLVAGRGRETLENDAKN